MNDTPEPGLGFEPPPAKAEAYRVLARKYRPQDFTGLIGQEALVRTLRNAFATGRIAHAFMLTGVRGVGKTTTARIIARALNCVGPDGTRNAPTIQPCGVCEPCVAIAESRHLDVQELDGASNNGVEEVRQIIDSVRYAPASARYKVYIIDEVHMLTKHAFNALLKTLEEPPAHVEFIFATTEIRRVPVTILSRCQRFDLRRIETGELVSHLARIAAQENVDIEPAALALIARAAEGSVRDGLSLLDQAIAHEEGHAIGAESVRAMLGLADRGRILDLFEKTLRGEIAGALAELRDLYERGADPLVAMQDLLEITHFLTRLKVVPQAEGFFDGGSGEAKRAAALAAGLSLATLTRTWQILLKGLFEVRDATRPIAAAEMALVRLAYAAELPPTETLIRDAVERPASPTPPPGRPAARSSAPAGGASAVAGSRSAQTLARAESEAPPSARAAEETLNLHSLADLAGLAAEKGASILRVQIENHMHLLRLEPGQIEFRPAPGAPRTLAGDLAQKLREWTGTRWIVTVAPEGGAPTLVEQRKARHAQTLERVAQEPMVRAVLDRFPGSEIVAVRDRAESDIPPSTDEA
jgi:DNA polymerase-3 subunit gamma/tau